MLKKLLRKVTDGGDLTRREAAGAMNTIMAGGIDGAQFAALVVALRM